MALSPKIKQFIADAGPNPIEYVSSSTGSYDGVRQYYVYLRAGSRMLRITASQHTDAARAIDAHNKAIR